LENAKEIVQAGANILAAGELFNKAKNINSIILKLKNL
jgi:pentose-5-phosphate-3-epimerase